MNKILLTVLFACLAISQSVPKQQPGHQRTPHASQATKLPQNTLIYQPFTENEMKEIKKMMEGQKGVSPQEIIIEDKFEETANHDQGNSNHQLYLWCFIIGTILSLIMYGDHKKKLKRLRMLRGNINHHVIISNNQDILKLMEYHKAQYNTLYQAMQQQVIINQFQQQGYPKQYAGQARYQGNTFEKSQITDAEVECNADIPVSRSIMSDLPSGWSA